MLGKIIGAVAGAQAAKQFRNVDGRAGAVLGAAAVAMARRMGVKGLIATAAGGYALKRLSQKRPAGVRTSGPAS